MKTIHAQDWVTTLHGESSDDGWMDPTMALVGRTFFVAEDEEGAEATFASICDVDFFKLSHRDPMVSASDGDVVGHSWAPERRGAVRLLGRAPPVVQAADAV